MQILCLIAMEPPVSLSDDEIRNKKVDVIHAIRSIPVEQIHEFAVRGQYGSGWIEGEHAQGYRHEPNVSERSFTETFAAVKFYIDNWRWQGVPFYLRTGKRLAYKNSEVCIQFKPVPHQPFMTHTLSDRRPNRIILAIQPEEGILLRFESKYPGPEMHLSPVVMQFFYRETFQYKSHDAYETLLLDIMKGDATLFMRADQAEAAWEVLENILDGWAETKPTDFPNYQAGTWGPEAAEILIAQDGRSWVTPTPLQCQSDAPVCKVVPGDGL
jgi:glucose-6-phosphate 1-dehydrogenase